MTRSEDSIAEGVAKEKRARMSSNIHRHHLQNSSLCNMFCVLFSKESVEFTEVIFQQRRPRSRVNTRKGNVSREKFLPFSIFPRSYKHGTKLWKTKKNVLKNFCEFLSEFHGRLCLEYKTSFKFYGGLTHFREPSTSKNHLMEANRNGKRVS